MNILTYFERFAFRGVNFWDRATRAEYWCVMPVIWGLILLAFVWDVQEVWDFLLRREVPPLNPLYYESFALFTLTILPRAALTVRRLHDSGRSGKWASLPLVALMSGFTLVLGLGSALLTSSAVGGDALGGISLGFIMGAVLVGSAGSFWEGMFALAAALDAIGFDAIRAVIAELLAQIDPPPVETVVTNARLGLAEDPMGGGQLLAAMTGIIVTPFAAAFAHLVFMLMPTDRSYNRYGESSAKPITGPAQVRTSGNAMAGYAYLYEKTAAEEEALKLAQKEQLKALYRTRVLGQPETPGEPSAQ